MEATASVRSRAWTAQALVVPAPARAPAVE